MSLCGRAGLDRCDRRLDACDGRLEQVDLAVRARADAFGAGEVEHVAVEHARDAEADPVALLETLREPQVGKLLLTSFGFSPPRPEAMKEL